MVMRPILVSLLCRSQPAARVAACSLAFAAALSAQRPYVASAGTPPAVSVRSIAGGPAIGAIPSGPHVIQPLGALGGAYLGNAISRPLGGGIVVNGPGGGRLPATGQRRPVGAVRSIAFGSYVPPYVEVPVEVPVSAPAPPVIINQYFSTPGSEIRSLPPVDEPAPRTSTSANRSGDLLAPAENYYLIAYKDRSMYAALAWWLEGNTLHYVTTQNTHNQASLDLIDLDRTTRLNQDRNIPFTIAGR
jgi:hypothetical protein